MKIKRIVIVVFILATFQLGCAGLEVATSQADIEALQKIRSGQYELIKSGDLAQLKKDAEIGRSVGRFHLEVIGFRTWRLDTATGTSCLLLTSEAEWKKPEIQTEACPP
jgi:hypothetical protein